MDRKDFVPASAKWVDASQEAIAVTTVDGEVVTVPVDEKNWHYQAVLESGITIEAADVPVKDSDPSEVIDSKATDVTGLVADHNALLAALRLERVVS